MLFPSLVLTLGLSLGALFLLAPRFRKCRRQLATERYEAQRRLDSQHDMFLAILQNGNDGILLMTPEAQILYASPSTQQVCGFSGETLVGRSVLHLVQESDRCRIVQALDSVARGCAISFTLELRCRRTDGSWRWTECTGRNLHTDPAVHAIVATLRDIDAYKACQEQLTALAVTDPLTGLANYRRLMETLDSEIKRCDRTGRPCAILMLDLDGLKQINDAHGHLTGSRALCRVAEVLRTTCRSIDTPTRYGGDEFVVVLPESNREVAREVAERITARLIGRRRDSPPVRKRGARNVSG